MARRRKGRKVNGILVLNKAAGISSSDAVQRAKRLFNAQKVGHTGSLDPLATGVLPLCFGEATKFSQYLLASDKRYWTRVKLGVVTNTGDADGEVIREGSASHISEQDVRDLLPRFTGNIEQIPSMYSALKHNGQPLYKLARQGIEVERQPRQITVFSNELAKFDGDEIELEIHCTKGTYIRTIAEDLGEALGCGAHVVALHRRSAGPFGEHDMRTLEDLELGLEGGSLDRFLRPVADAVGQWPEVELSESCAFYMRQGQPVQVPHAPTSGWVRLSEQSSDTGNGPEQDRTSLFLGVGEILDDGRVAPRRLIGTQ